MRVSFNTVHQARSVNTLQKASPAAKVSRPEVSNNGFVTALSFKGASPGAKNVFVGAEVPPFYSVGGVSVVMRDFKALDDAVVITPYYNGKIKYDSKTGEPAGEASIHKLEDGTPIFTNQDLEYQPISEIVKDPSKYNKLKKIASKEMEWGMSKPSEIALYQVLEFEKDKDKNFIKDKDGNLVTKGTNDYFVYTDATAMMPKPYATPIGGYPSAPDIPSGRNWQGDPYAKFNKAVVELLPLAKKAKSEGEEDAFEAKTVICNDSQAAYVGYHAFSDWKNKGDSSFYSPDKVNITQVGHNLGDGYISATSPRNMLVNLGLSKEDLKEIEDSEQYTKAIKIGDDEVNKVLKGLMGEQLIDANGNPNPMTVQGFLREIGYLHAYTTVSEEYANSVASNPIVAPALYPQLNKLYNTKYTVNGEERRLFDGIMNPLDNPNMNPYKPVPQANYSKEVALPNGEKLKPFEVFKEGGTYDEMRAVKQANRINLLKRLSGDPEIAPDIIGGVPGKKCSLIGNIDKKWVDKLEKGGQIDLIVTLGRVVDDQKGMDTVIQAFSKFALTEEGKNAVLVLGGEMVDGNAETEIVKKAMKDAMANPELNGRLVFINGWAPNVPMASAGDVAFFLSRREPCGLTDLEFIKYFCTPIVTNTQGFKQKNFDPRIPEEAQKATAYKTLNEFSMTHETLLKASESFKKGFDELLEKEKKKLTVRGVESDKVEELATEGIIKYSSKYAELKRQCADEIIVAEAADALKAFFTQDRETAETIYNNQVKFKTGWKDNGELHPSGKSTLKLYEDLHFKKTEAK